MTERWIRRPDIEFPSVKSGGAFLIFSKTIIMKTYREISISRLAAILLAVSLIIVSTSCDKEPVESRPELPPVESLMMSFTDFDGPRIDTKATGERHLHFNYAFTSLVFWSGASAVTMALPVAAYAYALEQGVEYLGDNSWEWTYSFPWSGVDYTATLTAARINNEEFSMEMLIAPSATPEQGVRWFDGVVRYDHTRANWTIYKDGSIEVLEVEWAKDYELGDASLLYTYVEPALDETGSYISYEYAPLEAYDASFTVSRSTGTTLVQWNTTSKEGRVQDEAKFGDAEWNCWDTLENGLVDKVCE